MKALKFLLPLLLVSLLAYALLSPYLALHQFKTALDNKDTVVLDSRINYPPLRDSLKSQMRNALASKLASRSNGRSEAFASLGMGLAMMVIEPMVDSMVSPQGLAGMMRDNPHAASRSPDKAGSDAPAKTDPFAGATTHYRSWDQLDVVVPRPEGNISLVFKRDTLRWKLTDILLPASALPL